MNGNQPDSGRVDQLFIGYSSSGMRALQSTFNSIELHGQWEQTLIHYVRLGTSGRDDPPLTAFTYITFSNGSAAILRRVRAGDSIGRNNAHALIGTADLLGPVALDMTRWDHWMSAPEPVLQPLTKQDLRISPNAADSLDDAANSCAEFAIPLMGWVLSQPLVRLSSIALDQELIVPTLRLFERVLKPLFSVETRTRNWSFSTYEVTDEVTDADRDSLGRPELIFLPKQPDHAGENRHQRVFFDETMGVDGSHQNKYQELASVLFEKYIGLGCEEYTRVIDHKVGTIQKVESRIYHLLNVGFDQQQYVPEPVRATQPSFATQPSSIQKAASPWERAVGGSARYQHQSATRASAGHAPEAGRTPGPGHTHGPETSFVDTSRRMSSDDAYIVRQLATAKEENDIYFQLFALRERITPASETNDYRWELICRHKIIESLPRYLYLWDLAVAYGHVLEFAFGAGATALHEPRFFALVESHIKNPKTNPFFGCMVYYFVQDSRIMSQRCTQLLHQRPGRLASIPLAPGAMNGLNGGFAAANWGKRLVLPLRNRQVLIILILLLLVATAIISMIFTVWR